MEQKEDYPDLDIWPASFAFSAPRRKYLPRRYARYHITTVKIECSGIVETIKYKSRPTHAGADSAFGARCIAAFWFCWYTCSVRRSRPPGAAAQLFRWAPEQAVRRYCLARRPGPCRKVKGKRYECKTTRRTAQRIESPF
jgi:hypothetical protein